MAAEGTRPGAKKATRRTGTGRAPRAAAGRRGRGQAAGPRAVPPSLRARLPPRRDLAVLGLIVIALLSALALVAPDAPLLRLWRDTLLSLFGRGAPFVLAALLLLVIGQLPTFERLRPARRQVLGGGLLLLALIGLLHLPATDLAREAARGEGGGQLGLLIAGSLTALVGRPGAWVLLPAILLGGVLLLVGVSVATLGRAGQAVFRTATRGMVAVGRGGLRVGRVAWELVRRPPRAPRRTLEEEYAATLRQRARGAARAAEPAAAPQTTAPLPVSADAEESGPRLILPHAGGARVTPAEPTPAPAAGRPAQVTMASLLWSLPRVELLDSFPDVQPDPTDAQQKARVIDQTLASFKVDARVREIYAGPSFTQFAVEPGTGVKVRRITELQNDLALALAVSSLRIEAPVPGKARVGIEIPNATSAVVGMRETLEAEEWAAARRRFKLPLVLGRDVSGKPVVVDMARMPHLLIAGATGAGKSVCLNALITCLLLQFSPDELRMVMVDPKRVELSSYNGVPHLQAPVVTEMDKVVGVLRKAVVEMERRYDLLQQLGVRNLDGYLARCAQEPTLPRMPYLLLVIDELADLMMTAPEEVEGLLCRLAQMGRATGIHLVLATQRPSVDVVTGLIKANFPSRIAFAVSSQIDSRVILDSPGAERLMGRGDMLYQAADAPKPQRIQGVFLSDPNIEAIVTYWRRQVEGPTFDPEWTNLPAADAPAEGDGGDDLLEEAIALVRQQGTASASMLQRRLRIGYNRAARLVETLEEKGIIGPANGRTRPVLEAGDGPAAMTAAVPESDKDDEDLPL